MIDLAVFRVEHLDAAADLLCREHRRLAKGGARVPDALLDGLPARELLAEAADAAPGMVALDAGRIVGFLLARAGGRVRLHEHQAEAAIAREAYRRLYAEIADRLIEQGVRCHRIDISVDAPETVAAWFELGFGVDQIKGLRAVGGLGNRLAAARRVRSASPADLDELADLSLELVEFHELTPVLRRASFTRAQALDSLRRAMSEESSAVLVAEVDGGLAGMMEVELDRQYESTATIYMAVTRRHLHGRGIGSAVLAAVGEWATRQGCTSVAVGWTSANLVSDRFWRGHGFRPIRYTLLREFVQPSRPRSSR